MKYSKIELAKEIIKHKGFFTKVPHIFRMVKAWRKGEYKIRFVDILLPTIAVIYVLSPIDIIPDFFLGVGALDDIAILAFAIPLLMKEVDKFLLWEVENSKGNIYKTIDAEVVK